MSSRSGFKDGTLATIMGGRLSIVAVSLARANDFIDATHRHHQPVVGHKFSIGILDDARALRGVATVGRPVARARDDGETLEVTRVATDGCENACSALYGAAWRAGKALGYARMGTYTLASEPGTSLDAAGWHRIHLVPGRSWDAPSRRRSDRHPLEDKWLWEAPATGRVGSFLMDDEAEKLAKRLVRVARQASEATRERDRLIGELFEKGVGLREIARHAGIAHPSVRKTLVRDGHIRP